MNKQNTMHTSSGKTSLSFYFFCEPLVDLNTYPNANTDYQHCTIALAEGLVALGHTCYGNVDYWQSYPDAPFLIQTHHEIKNHEAIIISSHWLLKQDRNSILETLPTHIPVFLMADMQEEIFNVLHLPNLQCFEKILLAGYVSSYDYPNNVVPWAFGLSNRIIEMTQKYERGEKTPSLLYNFRMGHTSRALVEKYMLSSFATMFEINRNIDNTLGTSAYDMLMDKQTGRRHYPSYYKTLARTNAIASFGGYFSAAISKNRFAMMNRVAFKLIRAMGHTSHTLIQHDSWRWWEGLAAGCLSFHVDFDECGVVYPVPFKNFKHYIGVPLRFFKPHRSKDFIDFLPREKFESIRKQGRDFALQHYAPISVAKRFLNFL